MALYKRDKKYWMDVVVNGRRYREPLHTTDGRKAPALERERISELEQKPPYFNSDLKSFSRLTINGAVEVYVSLRSHQVSARMKAYWEEQARPLTRSRIFRDIKLSEISAAHLGSYQQERLKSGKAPKTVNGEVSVLRQLLKHAKLWYKFVDEYKPLRNTKPPVGKALTAEQTAHLLSVARSRSDWTYAYTAATLSFYCGMRACEIKGLRWSDIDWLNAKINISRSKTPAGWRSPSLNRTCLSVLEALHDQASLFGATDPDHFVFPWHGREQVIDPTRSMTSWKSAWNSIRRKAGLPSIRFHDGRHTVITILAENGVADWVIQAQVGHVDPQMMKTYSHIRRKALDEAATILEPSPLMLRELGSSKLG